MNLAARAVLGLACALAIAPVARAQTFAPQRDDFLVSRPARTAVFVGGRGAYKADADGAARFDAARATGLLTLPLPIFGVLAGDFAGDGLDDLLLTQAPGGPYLLVNRAGFFTFDHRTRRDRDRPPNLGHTWLRGLEGRPDVDLPLPFVDALVGDFSGSALDDLILPHGKRGPLLLENRGNRFELAPLRFDRATIPYELG
ncbi:MAG: hypothetical protein KC466_21550, partial [Myxococcales bacterium]|nr:hypothetical protein [Myxococcales bacterium]